VNHGRGPAVDASRGAECCGLTWDEFRQPSVPMRLEERILMETNGDKYGDHARLLQCAVVVNRGGSFQTVVDHIDRQVAMTRQGRPLH